MSKSYSVFVENKYYYDFVALYNSWKYYESKIPIKVYIAGDLTNDRRIALEKIVKVIDVTSDGYGYPHFKGKYLFKWIGLSKYMEDYEILLDADTIFLSNIDFLFDELEKGKLIGAREHVDVIHSSYVTEGWPDECMRIRNELRKYVGDVADNYVENLITPTYNAGLIGFSKLHHKFLLDKCIEILISDFDAKKNPISHLEQFMMSLLLQLYSIDMHILPQLEWMNTWDWHRNPKKILKIEDGKFVLYNEGGNKINFYHFTGGIGMIDPIDNLEKTCRMHQIYESQVYESQFKREDVEKLWYDRYQNPVILLYEHFANKGL